MRTIGIELGLGPWNSTSVLSSLDVGSAKLYGTDRSEVVSDIGGDYWRQVV